MPAIAIASITTQTKYPFKICLSMEIAKSDLNWTFVSELHAWAFNGHPRDKGR